MKDRIDRAAAALQAEAVEMLQQWIRIPSVKEPAEEGAPFGQPVRTMLEQALSDCARLGMETRNFDSYIGDATWGEGDTVLGVLTHLDVVPAGDGWKIPPFSGQIEKGRIYGRGTGDDKGPAVAAVFAVKALMDAGVSLGGKVRIVFGCDEESGWEDMDHYRKQVKMPDFGFTPDANYPVINTEKGIAHFHVTGTFEDSRLVWLAAGERANVIPGMARAKVRGWDAAKLRAAVAVFANTHGWPMAVREEADGLIIEATGVTGHAAFPNGTRNAAGMMLRLLDALEMGGPMLRKLSQTIGVESDGASMGIACHDAASGALTLNLGILNARDGAVSATLDIRYPVHVSADALLRTMRQRLEEVGGQVERGHEHLPLHVPAQHPVVVKLGQVYHELTGGDPAPYSIGGGTYARSMDNCVAFGANFPGREELAHQAGEYVAIEDLMMNIRIFAHAIVALLGAKA